MSGRRLLALAFALAGCNGSAQVADGGAASSASAAAPAPPSAERRLALLTAEHRRMAASVTPEDQASRDVTVRRAAARALARIADDAARPGLLRALSDEDGDVVAWAAYGLGFSCKGHEKDSVAALAARALSLPEDSAGARSQSGRRFDTFAALARSVGRCAAETSEPTLVAWLGLPRERATAAALGLGDLGAVQQKLREETHAALLAAASGSASAPPIPEALFAAGRLENVPPSVVDRIREVATARLAEPGEGRAFAVRALGRAGADAAPELARVVGTPGTFSAAERADAVKSLSRLDKAGQRALAEVIPKLVPSSDPVAATALVGDDLGVLLAAIDALKAPGSAQKALRELAAYPAPPGAPASIVRRASWIRCTAAKAIAAANFHEPLLVACDLTTPTGSTGPLPGQPGSIGARAVVEVIGRAEITGPRLAAWRAYATGGDLRAREAAIELLGDHEEIEGAAAVLAEALAAKDMGVAATAADVLAKHPQRANEEKKPAKKRRKKKDKEPEPAATEPSPAVTGALAKRIADVGPTEDLELVASLVDAAGALGLKDATPKLEALCASNWPVAREHSQKALGLIGKKVECKAPAAGGDAPAELAALPTAPVTLVFQTDVGELEVTLDPEVAPVTAARIAELAKSGYYKDNVVHRVVPGFVTQLGAPLGDGYGGPAGRPPLRCETSPLPFAAMTVGVALSGRDTGSSQIFVMHGRSPHLDGNYAWIGTAKGPWAAFVDGDLVRNVEAR